MKNVQVIDSATNCTYDIFAIKETDFALLFPTEQDIEFIDDFVGRVGEVVADRILTSLWKQRLNKRTIRGIHGTLFYDLPEKKVVLPDET